MVQHRYQITADHKIVLYAQCSLKCYFACKWRNLKFAWAKKKLKKKEKRKKRKRVPSSSLVNVL